MDKVLRIPDHIADPLGRTLARFLPDLFVQNPELRARYQEWLKTPEGAKYANTTLE